MTCCVLLCTGLCLIEVFICRGACAIELQHTVVVTGGEASRSIVQVYNISGPQEQLPDLLTARHDHACAHYVDSENRIVRVYYIILPTLIASLWQVCSKLVAKLVTASVHGHI